MRIDLHSHSTVSDGTLTPAALVAHAQVQNLDVLALTDHDSVDGIQAAQRAAGDVLQIVPGVEISVTWNGQTVHIVGLHVDPEHPGLLQGLAALREYRVWRAEEIARRLEKKGIHGALEGAQAWAKGSLIGRTHFARFLVEHGYCESVREVFKRYLVKGKPGHVRGQWATLGDAVGWIRAAGGIAVIAHPARYRLTATRLRALIADFKDCGGEGIEVISGSHSRDEVLAIAEHSRRQELLASCGSDYHGPENPWVELGRLATLPDDLIPIWRSPNWPGSGEAQR
jgi:predicted metal-dependent phosphoesterase TrpH